METESKIAGGLGGGVRDLSNPGVREWAAKQNLFDTVCTETVKNAVLLLEELGY